MKKIITFIVTIVLMISFAGCSNNQKLATDKEIRDFVKTIEDILDNENKNYSYEYTRKYTSEVVEDSAKEERKLSSKGIVSVEYSEGFPSRSFSIKGTEQIKYVESYLGGKNTTKTKVKESTVYISSEHTSENESSRYIDFKGTHTSKNVKLTKTFKTLNNNSSTIDCLYLNNLIDDLTNYDNYFYISNNKYRVIVNSTRGITEYNIKFNGDSLVSIDYVIKTSTSKDKVSIKFKEFTRIERPKDYEDYKTV